MSGLSSRPSGPPALVPEVYEPPERRDIPMKAADEAPGFFDKPGNIKGLQVGFLVILALLVASDLFLHYHEYIGLEWVPGFNTLFSFVACLGLFALSKTAAAFLKRGEDYYE